MTNELLELRRAVEEAVERVWFVRSIEENERTDTTLSLRLYVRPRLFVQVFLGTKSGSLYLALIEGGRRLYGMDREAGEWHLHPFGAVDTHKFLPQASGSKPLLKFLAQVEDILLEHDLL